MLTSLLVVKKISLRSILMYLLGLVFRHPVTGTNIVPLLPDDRIVLVRRRDTGKWALPGGMVIWGESIPSTVKRELAEETGLELIEIRRLVGVYSSPYRDSRVHSICVVVAASVRGKMAVEDLLEISEVKAFRLDELPSFDQLSYDNSQQLQDYLDDLTVVR